MIVIVEGYLDMAAAHTVINGSSKAMYYTTAMLFVKATWRNGSAFGFDCLTVPKGCRFESCGGHFFPIPFNGLFFFSRTYRTFYIHANPFSTTGDYHGYLSTL